MAKKWIITVSQESTYEFDADKYSEEEACNLAWDYFEECEPEMYVESEVDEDE